jgi:hypothetical protein
MALKYEVTYQLISAASSRTVKCGDDDDLNALIADMLGEGVDFFQVRHLQCAHRWVMTKTGQIPGDRVNWHTFQCEKCKEIMREVLDYELCKLHEMRNNVQGNR